MARFFVTLVVVAIWYTLEAAHRGTQLYCNAPLWVSPRFEEYSRPCLELEVVGRSVIVREALREYSGVAHPQYIFIFIPSMAILVNVLPPLLISSYVRYFAAWT